jgi:hypothetical protein
MRIIVRCLAGTPHKRGNVTGTWIFIRLDHYGLPCILPLKLREYIRQYVNYCEYSEGGKGFELKTQDQFHPNKWNDTALPYHTKRIVAVLSVAGIFRVLSTKVKADLSTVVSPFTGRYSSLPMPLIKEALRALTTITTIRQIFDPISMTYSETTKVVRGKDLSSVVNAGKFNPHFSAKAGPNGSLSTWSAALDAIAFMHEPKKALLLLGWMMNQGAYAYILWFIFLNIVFGIPYIIWFNILEFHDKWLSLITRYSWFYHLYEDSIGRFFAF